MPPQRLAVTPELVRADAALMRSMGYGPVPTPISAQFLDGCHLPHVVPYAAAFEEDGTVGFAFGIAPVGYRVGARATQATVTEMGDVQVQSMKMFRSGPPGQEVVDALRAADGDPTIGILNSEYFGRDRKVQYMRLHHKVCALMAAVHIWYPWESIV